MMTALFCISLAMEIGVAAYSIQQTRKSGKALERSFSTVTSQMSDQALGYYKDSITAADVAVQSSLDQFVTETSKTVTDAMTAPVISYTKDIQDAASPFNAHATNTAASANKIF